MASDDTEAGFRVIYVESVRARLEQLAQKANQLGIASDFSTYLQKLDDDLHSRPMELGEPVYDLKHASLHVRIAAEGFLVFSFGVDEARRLVYVSKCKVLSGHGL